MQVKQEFNFDEFYLNVKQYLNNGIPNVHLSKGCIGELCIFEENEGKGMAIIYLWQPEFNDFLGLRNEFKRLGASKIHIYETMDDESVSICNGVNADGLGRSITVEFVIEQHCEALRVARSKAYRDIWDMVYRVARTEKYNDKNNKGENTLLLVNLILRATRKSITENAVNIDDVILMIEKTVDISLQDATLPTLSELRRFELKQEVDKAAWTTEYNKKNKHFSTAQQVWKAFYRANRIRHKTECVEDISLFYKAINEQADIAASAPAGKMVVCVLDIFYPLKTMTESEIHRLACKNVDDFINGLNVTDFALSPFSPAPFDEDCPF